MTLRTHRRAFTLIELLLVLVILGVLAAVVVPKFTGTALKAKIQAAQVDLSEIKNAIGRYEVDHDMPPTTEQGLAVLVNPPPSSDGSAPVKYLEKLPIDPWGQPYNYSYPSAATPNDPGSYDISSSGPDMTPGTADDIYPK